MPKTNVFRVSAFTKDGEGGNEAGVVFMKHWPNESFMQEIARKVGYSETAFVVMEKEKVFVRYFTPLREVAMCGHASLALIGTAYEKGLIDSGVHTLYAKTTTVTVNVQYNGVTLQFKRPVSLKTFKRFEPLDRLNLKNADLSEQPVSIMDSGVKELYIGLKSLEKLKTYQPDMDAIQSLSVDFNVAGIYLYHLDIYENVVHARNFLPAIGIKEESATGTATAALMAHIHDTLDLQIDKLVFHQGDWMGKPSRLVATYNLVDGNLEGVLVSGTIRLLDSITI